MKIILIGFMGAGKTAISKLLAAKLHLQRREMDDLITEKSGRKSNWEIFDKDGELVFRELEIAVAKDLRSEQNIVISTGGGVILNKINIDYLRKDGIIIFLKNAFETSEKRLPEGKRPPLFRDIRQAKKLYDFRQPLYNFYADIVIETDTKTPEEVVEEIISKLN